MKTIVTITPIAIERDSRTLKQAASISRFGYRSLVFEGEKSRLDIKNFQFNLQNITSYSSSGTTTEVSRFSSTKLFSNLKNAIRRFTRSNPESLMTQCLYLLAYFRTELPRLHKLVSKAPAASIYYLHGFQYFPAVYYLCRKHNSRFVYDAHDFYSRIETMGRKDLLGKYWLWLERNCIRKAAAVVTVCDSISALHLKEFGKRSLVLRNCQDERMDSAPKKNLRELLGLRDDIFLLVAVGQAKPGQAIPEVLQTIQKLPKYIHLALLGRGYEKYDSMIKEAGLDGRVHLVAPVMPFEVVPFIASANLALILYYPRSVNYKFCLPNGFFQPISARIPMLYPQLPEILKIAKCYMLGLPIDPLVPETIRSAIMRLIEDPVLVEKCKTEISRAQGDLNWEKEEVGLKDLLRTVIDGQKKAGL